MARKSNKRKATNPLSQQQAAVRAPRMSVRGQLTMNTIMQGNTQLAPVTTNANGLSGYVYPLVGQDLGTIGSASSDPIGRAATLYQQYKYLPGTLYTHVPSVGVNTPGNVYIAYVTNPEIIEKLIGFTTGIPNYTAFINGVRSIGNCKSIPIWQQTTLMMELIYRRPKFDVNAGVAAASAYTDPNENDRSVQGAFLVAIEGAPATTVVARPYMHKKVQLFELQASGLTQ